MEFKQVIVMRSDLKLPKGKMAAQAAHAAVEATLKSNKKDKDIVKNWRNLGQKKVVLKVGSKEELLRIKQSAKDAGLVEALITDAGRTVVAPGTMTCIAIGPDEESRIDEITGSLKMI